MDSNAKGVPEATPYYGCSCGQKIPRSIVDEVVAKRRQHIPTDECFCGMELEAGLCPNGHDPIRTNPRQLTEGDG